MTGKRKNIIDFIVLPVMLLIYTLLLVNQGVTPTDTGYNYANFIHFDSLDNMWKFSTYLASVCGAAFTHLPLGKTMLGLNIYTGLLKYFAALIVYLFVVKKLKMPVWAAFLAELCALGFAWCPSALIYNYLTYLLFTASGILLIAAVMEEKNIYYLLAGICLGLNTMVRLPNIAETGMIVAVWVICFLQKDKFVDVLKETGICIGGFLVGFAVPMAYIAVRYGISAYIQGIQELFAMPQDAGGYTLKAMVYGNIQVYLYHSKYLIMGLLVIALGTVLFAIMKDRLVWVKRVLFAAISVGLIGYFKYSGLFTFSYYNYSSIYTMSIIFVMIAGIMGLYVLFFERKDMVMRMYACVMGLMLLITPLGSNNNVFTVVSNLFLTVPFVFIKTMDLAKAYKAKNEKLPWLSAEPLCIFTVLILALFLAQSVLFGATFVFRDGMNGEKRDAKVEGVPALVGMHTQSSNAKDYETLQKFLENEGLLGSDVIIYGNKYISEHGLPSLAFYFDLKPAISTVWPDLDSFVASKFEKELINISESGSKPLIIVQDELKKDTVKEELLTDFIMNNNYEAVLKTDMYIVYR